MDLAQRINFGIIIIDKPSGPTSFSISSKVRKTLGLSKTSHMGTLDPKVTGVLPVTLGKACRLASFLIGSDKEYTGVLHTHKPQEIENLQRVINEKFVGEIQQIPPHKSAVKRQMRKRTVHFFNIINSSENKRDFTFTCKVQGGTYIRKICSDLGELIGGAHMGDLRRAGAGVFGEDTLVGLDEFEKAVKAYQAGNKEALKHLIVPAEQVIRQIMPCLEVHKKSISRLIHGGSLMENDLVDDSALKDCKKKAFAMFHKDLLIGVYEAVSEGKIIARPLFVNI